jgi:hypothetical protein
MGGILYSGGEAMNLFAIKIRHAERSEVLRTAVSFCEGLLHCRAARAVEGTGRFCARIEVTKRIYAGRRSSAAGRQRDLPRLRRGTRWQPRSFDSGSAEFSGKRGGPLAVAQDDGVIVRRLKVRRCAEDEGVLGRARRLDCGRVIVRRAEDEGFLNAGAVS